MARGKKATRKQCLRELTVQKACPEARAYLIWDTKQTHLALQVHPTGSKSWYCIYSRRGRSRWYNIGDASVIGLADARTIAAEVMLDVVARGRDPAAERPHKHYLAEHTQAVALHERISRKALSFVEVIEENHKLKQQLAGSDGSLFDLRRDSAEDIVGTIVTHISEHKAKDIANGILTTLKKQKKPAG